VEELSIYNCQFVYVKGEDNSVTDTLSRLPYKYVEKGKQANAQSDAEYPFSYHAEDPITVFAPKEKPVMCTIVAALVDAAPRNSFRVTIDDNLLEKVKESYTTDTWCQKLLHASEGLPSVQNRSGLWYIGERLVPFHGPPGTRKTLVAKICMYCLTTAFHLIIITTSVLHTQRPLLPTLHHLL